MLKVIYEVEGIHSKCWGSKHSRWRCQLLSEYWSVWKDHLGSYIVSTCGVTSIIFNVQLQLNLKPRLINEVCLMHCVTLTQVAYIKSRKNLETIQCIYYHARSLYQLHKQANPKQNVNNRTRNSASMRWSATQSNYIAKTLKKIIVGIARTMLYCFYFKVSLRSGLHQPRLPQLGFQQVLQMQRSYFSCVKQPLERGCSFLSPWKAERNGACSRGSHSEQHKKSVSEDTLHERTWSMTCGNIPLP